MRVIHVLGTLASVSVAASTVLVACADDAAVTRPGYDEPDASGQSGSDGGTAEAASPSPTKDAATDSGEKRGPFDPADEPVTCADAGPCATQLVAGRHHFCALISDGTVRCWGADEYGALGGGDPPKDAPPDADAGPVRAVAGIATATQISAARATTCARLADGSVQCWGSNSHGQLGLDDVQPVWDQSRHPAPSPVALREPATRVDVGPYDVCAVLATGKVSCWGQNDKAQLTRTPLDYVMGPGLAALDPLAVAQASFSDTTGFLLTTAGDVFSWGAVAGNDGWMSARLSSISPDAVPNKIVQLAKVSKLVTSEAMNKDEGGPLGIAPIGPIPGPGIKPHGHGCALAGGELFCWGRSDTGALCTGLPDEELLPAHAPLMKGRTAWPQQLAVGDELTCARMTDGTVQCCGANGRGRLGTGFTDLFSAFLEPVVSFTGHAVQVATSHRSVCALVQGGSVECWGSNAHGELATGTPDENAHPTPVKVNF